MKNFKTGLLIAVTLAVTNICVVRGGLITGSVIFGGTAMLNTSSASTATAVTSWNATVSSVSGSFTNIASGTPITFGTANWNFNTNNPATNFCSVGGFKFELLSSTITYQSGPPGIGVVFVSGTGVVSGNSYTPTTFAWSFHTQDPSSGGYFSFGGSLSSQNSNGQPVLVSRPITNANVLIWSDPTFTLQASPNVNGPYTNVPGATSPYTNLIASPQLFFRLDQ